MRSHRTATGGARFARPVESKDFGRVEATLAPDVRFRSPVVFAPSDGRETVGTLLRVVGDVLAPELGYRWQIREGDREVLCLIRQVGGLEVEALTCFATTTTGWWLNLS